MCTLVIQRIPTEIDMSKNQMHVINLKMPMDKVSVVVSNISKETITLWQVGQRKRFSTYWTTRQMTTNQEFCYLRLTQARSTKAQRRHWTSHPQKDCKTNSTISKTSKISTTRRQSRGRHRIIITSRRCKTRAYWTSTRLSTPSISWQTRAQRRTEIRHLMKTRPS